MSIFAIIHTEGFVVLKDYRILEIAYMDCLGITKNFLIKSPISFEEALNTDAYIHKSLEVVICVKDVYRGQRVYTFREILNFLQKKYKMFQTLYGSNVVFGYKGYSYQKNILVKCNIPHVNIEALGVPSISILKIMYPDIRKNCLYHTKEDNKCAKHILQLIDRFLYG